MNVLLWVSIGVAIWYYIRFKITQKRLEVLAAWLAIYIKRLPTEEELRVALKLSERG